MGFVGIELEDVEVVKGKHRKAGGPAEQQEDR